MFFFQLLNYYPHIPHHPINANSARNRYQDEGGVGGGGGGGGGGSEDSDFLFLWKSL